MVVNNGMVFGVKVSDYGLKHNKLDYQAMAELVGPHIFNGIVRDRTMNDWKLVNGEFEKTVMADYIISEYGAKFLIGFTDELVFYNSTLDMYIWAVTHWGKDWDKVVSNVKLTVNYSR